MEERTELLDTTLIELLYIEVEFFDIDELRKNEVNNIVKKFLSIIKTKAVTYDDSK